MTDQTKTRLDGAIALGFSVVLVVADLSMSRAEFLRQGFWYIIAQPLVLITIPLGLYWLLKPLPRAAPQTPDDDHPSPCPEWESAPRIIVGGGMTNQNTAASW